MRQLARLLPLLVVLVALPPAAHAQSVTTYTASLSHPWDLAFLPDGGALLTERGGRVLELDPEGAVVRTVLTLPPAAKEGGALGLVLDPDFEANRFVYLYRTAPNVTNEVLRLRFDGDALVDQQVVLRGIPGAGTHNGGRLRFGPDGWLYVTTGDAQNGMSAQRAFGPNEPATWAGKLLRVPPEGYRDAGAGVQEVSRGHRNPQGLDWQPGTDQLYANEHGPTGNDEVNRIVRGANYGWPLAVGPRHRAPFVSPLATWSTIAPSGATFVRRPGSAWSGDYLIASLRGQQIRRLRFEGGLVRINEALFARRFGRLRTVVERADGTLYVLTDNGTDDRVLRIVPPPAG